MARKPSLSWKQQVQLLRDRGLGIADGEACTSYPAAQNYYRFSGYAR